MGSGSSRSGRALRRLRGSDRCPGGRSGAAPEARTAPNETREAAAGSDPGSAAPPDSRDDTLRLLDQLLAESAAWGSGEPTPRRPARSPPAAGAGSPVTPEDTPRSSGVFQSPGGSQEGSEKQLAVSYDCSEDELMASIEQEYCG